MHQHHHHQQEFLVVSSGPRLIFLCTFDNDDDDDESNNKKSYGFTSRGPTPFLTVVISSLHHRDDLARLSRQKISQLQSGSYFLVFDILSEKCIAKKENARRHHHRPHITSNEAEGW